LAQTDIPLEARIVALADVYDAIRSKRPYKAPKCHADAMKALAHGDERIGPGAFDPVILEAFGDLQYTISQTWDCAALRLLADSLRDRAMA
jgi:HD-GYP domain-containing protein (c-di-GMP phosphodiesterase class II)